MDHIVWIKAGGSWRTLACYATRQEALDFVRRNRADGEEVQYAIRGGWLDSKLRANVHRA